MGRSLFKDSGFNIALTDNGKPIPYTIAVDTPAEKKYYLDKYPNCSVLAVKSLRIVQVMHGRPANQDKWKEWGYKPQANAELSCIKH